MNKSILKYLCDSFIFIVGIALFAILNYAIWRI